MPQPSLIAIDGPVAVGKTTMGRLIAERLGYRFIDTGMMYRALAWLALHLSIDPEDEDSLSKLAAEAKITFSPSAEKILINHFDVTTEICSPEVEAAVSRVSQISGVRRALVAQQQCLAERGNVVMVGRDIGTVVLPHSELKVFLTASPEERARRRYIEQARKGKTEYEAILAELRKRDEIDSHRSLSPLHPAPDAHIIDTEGLIPTQVAKEILALVEKN